MANGFTATPGIVPGNLKVNGQLTVSGGLISVQTDTYFLRMGKMTNGTKGISWNKSAESGGLDDPLLAGLYEGFDPGTARLGGERTFPGNIDQQWHRGAVFATSNNPVSVTGTTSPTIVGSFAFGAEQFAVSSPSTVHIEIWGEATLAAGHLVSLSADSGATNLIFQQFTVGSGKVWALDAVLSNQPIATAVNIKQVLIADGQLPQTKLSVIDLTTLNGQTYTVTLALFNAADEISKLGLYVEQLNTH